MGTLIQNAPSLYPCLTPVIVQTKLMSSHVTGAGNPDQDF